MAAMERRRPLEVRILSRTLVKASSPPPDFPPAIRASNLDLIIHSFHLFLVSYYPASLGVDFSALLDAVAAALPVFLNHFFPFAGRLDFSSPDGISVANNNAGAELVVADAGVSLFEVDFSDSRESLGRIAIPFASDLPISLQLVRFACGGFAFTWGSNHLLHDGTGFQVLVSAWAELMRTGSISREPHLDPSMFVPRSPPQFALSLDREFVEYNLDGLVNALLVDTLVRRLFFVEAADIEQIQRTASIGEERRASRFAAFSAYIWKLLAMAVDGLDEKCRMAWVVDGRRALQDKFGASRMSAYPGNVITYASREAGVSEVKQMPLAAIASLVREAIREVSSERRFQELVDWMEVKKMAGVKLTEKVGVGLGSPAVVVSALVTKPYECDFGFGRPAMTMPWLRPGRLGSASVIIVPSPANDGSWILSVRLWPRLAAVIEADEVFKPLTAARLGVARASSTTARPRL